MGLLKHLLFWPVTGPEFLVKFSLGKVEETMRRELTDDQSVKEDLLALQMRLELGEIDDAEYVEREAELMRRLREVREWREELGMGIAGGPVRVARQEGAEADAADGPAGDATPHGGIASPGGARVELDPGLGGG
ncbi:MAG: gas vesicle protein GvpG [Longimicrobiaceae bacterium]